jgi:hypothetical protein
MSKVKVGGEGDSLVRDGRVQKVLWALSRLVEVPEGLEFLTVRQDPVEIDGKMQPAIAIFYVISPHPLDGKIVTKGPLISIATMPFQKWVTANKEYRHYANLSDPLRPIFAGLLRQHLAHRKSLEEMKSADS